MSKSRYKIIDPQRPGFLYQ